MLTNLKGTPNHGGGEGEEFTLVQKKCVRNLTKKGRENQGEHELGFKKAENLVKEKKKESLC